MLRAVARGVLIVALFAGPAVAAPLAASANAQPAATIVIENQAQLNPGPPETVTITVRYSCPAPVNGQWAAAIDQNGLTSIGPVENAICDDQTHTASTMVRGTFAPGSASAVAAVVNGDGQIDATTQSEITIK